MNRPYPASRLVSFGALTLLLGLGACLATPSVGRADVLLPGSYTSNNLQTGLPPVGPIDLEEPIATQSEFIAKNLPFSVQTGFTILLDQGNPNDAATELSRPQDWSEVIAFTNVQGQNGLHGVANFASDPDNNTQTALDVLKANGLAGPTTDDNVVFLSESSQSNITLYQSSNLGYNIHSDPTETIPEPSGLALACVGGLGLLGYRLRRRR